MRKTALALLSLAPLLAAAPAAAEDTTPVCTPLAEVKDHEPIRCETEGVSVALDWEILTDTDELVVSGLAATADGKLQQIEGIDSRAPLSFAANGFEFADMNFDGHPDFRIIEFLPAGPNIPWLHWIYDPAAGAYVPAPSLNLLSNPQFEDGVVVSPWRDGAAVHGEDSYVWQDGQLVFNERLVMQYDADGTCSQGLLLPAESRNGKPLTPEDMIEASVMGGELETGPSGPCVAP